MENIEKEQNADNPVFPSAPEMYFTFQKRQICHRRSLSVEEAIQNRLCVFVYMR